ncbi:hypothetical protein RF11_04560 [Thelohanellus kitauei]|uniref:Uncharacterized protein n=1 Tax=Thelohanellus kitauei TaxID=669202 RepID=A0A0C2N3A9_THEKT|nr:hypothetical protein RF11_04560 [Thelohanellus kitauei]
MEVNRGSGRLEITKNKKLRLYIIYLSLLCYPVMDQRKTTWFCSVLTELNISFGKYLEKHSLKDHTIEDQFLIIRHYIKSLITFDIQHSWGEDEILTDFFERLAKNPSHKIHSSYLASLFLFEISDVSMYGELYLPTLLSKVQTFLHNLILALSDQAHIYQIQSQPKIFLYEDEEIDMCSIIDIHLARDFFSMREEQIRTTYKSKSSVISKSAQYKMFYQIMKKTAKYFDTSTFLDVQTSHFLLRLCDDYPDNLSPILLHQDTSDSTSFTKLISNISKYENIKEKHTIQTLLGFFNLIYEQKYIFTEINGLLPFMIYD